MPYASASHVARLTKNLVGPDKTFTSSTSPTLKAVNDWLSSGCSVIETVLGSNGYSTPVASTAGAYSWFTDLNGLWAAAWAEMSRSNVTLGPGERTRGQYFLEEFWSQFDRILKQDLTIGGGLAKSSVGGTIFVGGIKVADKQTIEQDTSLVEPRFSRGMFRDPGSQLPRGTTASRS